VEVYEVVAETTARDVIGRIVDENGEALDLGATATARLQGQSADLPGVYFNEACTVTDPSTGLITYPQAGMLVSVNDLTSAGIDKATFRCAFFYTDSAGATDYSEEFDITFKTPPIPNFTLTATFTAGSGHGITLSPAGGVYSADTVVTVTATGSTFVSWGGADAASMSVPTNPATITMSKDMVIEAVMS